MKPINNHVKIEPVQVEDFVQTAQTQYQEIGTVIEGAEWMELEPGSLVYFDSWLAKKYPVKGELGKFVWFVKYEDIVAYEPLPE